MIRQLQTSRTCSICGLKKPLVAFLELASHKYGDICDACRGSQQRKTQEDPSEKSGGTTRLQIDNKTRVQLDRDKKAQLKQATEKDHEEKTKKEAKTEEKSSENELREKEEKKYREEYLQLKKQAATKTGTVESNTREPQIAQAQGFYQEKARTTSEFHNKILEQSPEKKTTGITVKDIYSYVAKTGRSAESLFGLRLGQFLRNHLQTQGKNNITGPEKPAQQTEKAGTPSRETPKPETGENSATEFTRNNFKKR